MSKAFDIAEKIDRWFQKDVISDDYWDLQEEIFDRPLSIRKIMLLPILPLVAVWVMIVYSVSTLIIIPIFLAYIFADMASGIRKEFSESNERYRDRDDYY